MAAACVGVLGAFQYSAPRCDKKQRLPPTSGGSEPNYNDGRRSAGVATNEHGIITSDTKRSVQPCDGKDKDDTFEEICPKCNDEIVWVTKRYQPTDPRFDAPVPRFKIVAKDPDEICRRPAPRLDPLGEVCAEPTPRDWIRPDTEKQIFVSQHHTRCEQWSTLREMLPSRGRPAPVCQPNWGTGRATAPAMMGDRAFRFPHINSEMTKFCDSAYTVDPLFRLH